MMWVMFIWLAGTSAAPYPDKMFPVEKECREMVKQSEGINSGIAGQPWRFECHLIKFHNDGKGRVEVIR